MDAAVAAIQARLGAGDDAAGRLSVASPPIEAGALCLAEGGGSLSLAGQATLPDAAHPHAVADAPRGDAGRGDDAELGPAGGTATEIHPGD